LPLAKDVGGASPGGLSLTLFNFKPSFAARQPVQLAWRARAIHAPRRSVSNTLQTVFRGAAADSTCSAQARRKKVRL